MRGYATLAERHGKAVRAQVLRARLAAVERRLAAGRVSVVRGGRGLLARRANLAAAGLTEARWREQWEAARLFLTADGEKDKAWGNETIRWHPDEGWVEVKLPAPLAGLANRPHGRYRISCPAEFPYRGDEVAAQAATGAVRYDIARDPARGRWYLAASWRTAPVPVAPLEELRRHPVVAVDVNAGHLAVAVLARDGNPVGAPATIPLDLCGRPGVHVPVGGRALARPPPATGITGPRDWPSCGRRGDRQACARPPGAATGRRDRQRPADQPPGNCPPSTRSQGAHQGRQAPPGPTAATTMAEDRDGPAATPARPGDPRPFGAAGQPGPAPASSIGTVGTAIRRTW